jgi:DNA repair protein RecO
MYTNVHAVVLTVRRSGEFDKRLSLYTRERGRLVAFAKGAARPRARLAAATEPAVTSRFRLWQSSPSSLACVTGGALEASFPGLRESWSGRANAEFLCEWTDRLTAPYQPNPLKFELLQTALAALEKKELRANQGAVRTAFLVQFLEYAGYCVATQAADAATRPLAAALRDWDFESEPVREESLLLLEERLLRFVDPLLSRPLRSLAHLRELEGFRTRSLATL